MHHKKIDEVLNILRSDMGGLTSEEAELRLAQNGKNVIEKTKKQTLISKFFAQFKNVMVIILLISAIISISIAVAHKDLYELIEGLVILFIVVMNSCIGVYQENKAQACLDELEKKTTNHTTVLRDGKETRVLATDVVVGDIIILSAGDVVPADIRIIDSSGLMCDESSLTGESVPIEKSSGILDEKTILAERKNMAYSGSLITSGKGKGVVVSVSGDTEMGKIAKMLIHGKKTETPLQKSISKIGKFITITVLSVSIIIFFMELICVKDSNFISALMTAVALAVAGIPESLPAVITLIMALGVMQLAKRKVIIKRLHAVETLGSCEVICSDKTGTLTQNKMSVVSIVDAESKVFSTNSFAFKKLVNCMYLCNDGKIEKNEVIAEPTEKALLEFSKAYYDGEKRARIKEIAFDSTRKMMTTINKDRKTTVYTKGAIDKILKRCKYALINDEIKELDAKIIEGILTQNELMAKSALRVLAFCYKEIDDLDDSKNLEDNLIFIGLVGLKDMPRVEAKDAIKRCFKAGMKPVMITGDHKLTAFAIALDLGIAKTIKQVLTGEEIDNMTEKEFSESVNKYSVFARVTAEHKVKIVKAYKKLGKVVAMTGDGVNDAPSLKIADIGVGMGIGGTEVAKSVSDMIITDDNFNSIVLAVEEGRKVYSNIQKALQYLMSTNAVEIFGMLFSLLFFPNNVFLLPSQMLFINLVTDSLPAFALGVEKTESDIMEKPPRKMKSNLLSDVVGVNIVYQAILQMIIIICIYCGANRYYTPQVASTMVFFTIIWMQLLHSVNCKTNQSIIGKNLLDNKTFNVCFFITFIVNLIVCVLPLSYTIFGLEVLNLSQWGWVIISAVSIIPLCEIVKLIIGDSVFVKKNKPKRIKKYS